MSIYTIRDIAGSWSLWADYADPNGAMTREAFETASAEEKMRLLLDAFGPRPRVATAPGVCDDGDADAGYAHEVTPNGLIRVGWDSGIMTDTSGWHLVFED